MFAGESIIVVAIVIGGLQNTLTNLGASIGTALAGAVLISALTTSFFAGIADNPAVPDSVVAEAKVTLSAGLPFISDADLEAALDEAGVPPDVAQAIVDENEQARLDGLKASLAVLAFMGVLALFAGRRIQTQPVGASTQPQPVA